MGEILHGTTSIVPLNVHKVSDKQLVMLRNVFSVCT